MVTLDFLPHLVNESGGCLLSTETKREAECERERHHNALKQRLNKRSANVELEERHEHRKNPDCPLRHRTEKVRRVHACSHGRPYHDTLHRRGDDNRHEQNEHSDDNLRQVQDNLGEKTSNLREPQDIQRCHEEHHNNKPLNKVSDKAPGVKIEPPALQHIINLCASEQVINFERLDNLIDHLPQERPDGPANHKYDKSNDELRKEFNHSSPDVVKRTA